MEYSNPTKIKEMSCCICDNGLFSYDGVYKKWRKVIAYRDVYLVFTNGQKMRVSTCEGCFDAFDMDAAKFVMERHMLYWEWFVKKDSRLSEEQIEVMMKQYESLKLKEFFK